MTARLWTPDQVAEAVAAAPRGVWLAGMSSPAVGFWPQPQPSTGMPLQAPYACRCARGDSWACQNSRCPCTGRHRALQPSERPAGYGGLLPPSMAGTNPSCCAFTAMMSEVHW